MTSTGNPTASLSDGNACPTGVTFTDNGDGTATLAGTANGRGDLHDHHRRLQRRELRSHPVIHPYRRRGTHHHFGRQPPPSTWGHGTFTVNSTGTPSASCPNRVLYPRGYFQ